jgi:hypothetical protein
MYSLRKHQNVTTTTSINSHTMLLDCNDHYVGMMPVGMHFLPYNTPKDSPWAVTNLLGMSITIQCKCLLYNMQEPRTGIAPRAVA